MKNYLVIFIAIFYLLGCNAKDTNLTETITIAPTDRPIFVTENGVRYLRISAAAPIYECSCQQQGECTIRFTGAYEVTCHSVSCPATPGVLTSGCKWSKAKKVPQEVENMFRAKQKMLEEFPAQETFSADGIRFVSLWQIELQQQPHTITKSDNGETIVELSGGPKVKCSCDCELGGCGVTGGGTVLWCEGDCRMLTNGNPCNGCGWVLMPNSIKGN